MTSKIHPKIKTVLIFGAFDILHPGHLNFFKQAKNCGDKLIVVVARDKNIKRIKKRNSFYSEKKRLDAVKKLPIVDSVLLGNLQNRYLIVKKIKPDVICLGYDQGPSIQKLRTELKKLKLFPKILRLKPFHPEKYKSSLLAKTKSIPFQ